MTTYILDFIASHPVYAFDELSLNQWKADCRQELLSILEIHMMNTEEVSQSMNLYLDAHIDLAKKTAQSISLWPIQERQNNIARLLLQPQVEQRTDAWYTEAQNMITASQFAIILQDGLTRGRLVVEKASGNVDTSQRKTVVQTMDLSPFTWGIRFEPVVKQIYCDLTKTTVKDMGRLKHRTDTRLAASPDGMVTEGPSERYGRFVEFKAPVTRKLQQVIPKDYIIQMQIQMEVGAVEECDYLEVKFNSAFGTKVQALNENPRYSGNIYIISVNEIPQHYVYSPLNNTSWTPELQPNEEILETIPWTTSEYYLTTVGRSRVWFASVQPAIESFWKDVESAKANTFVLPESSRKRKPDVCMIHEET